MIRIAPLRMAESALRLASTRKLFLSFTAIGVVIVTISAFTVSTESKTIHSTDKKAASRNSGSVRAAVQAKPWVNFGDGYELTTSSEVESAPSQVLSPNPNDRRPTGVTSVDVNEDGSADLICAYADQTGGYIQTRYGKTGTLAPQQSAKTGNTEAFGNEMKLIRVPEVPDFVVTRDFDRDGKTDILTATRGGRNIYLLSGNGHGKFANLQSIALPGSITTMLKAEMADKDAAEIVIGIDGEEGPSIAIYKGMSDVLSAKPITYKLSASATSIALGRLDDDSSEDLAVIAGGKIFILHRGDPSQSTSEDLAVHRRETEEVQLPFAVRAVAVGDFIWDRDSRMELAVVSEDGSVQLLSRGELDTRPLIDDELRSSRRLMMLMREGKGRSSKSIQQPKSSAGWQVALTAPITVSIGDGDLQPSLLNVLASGQKSQDLLIVDPSAKKLHITTRLDPQSDENKENGASEPQEVLTTLEADSEPITVLPVQIGASSRPALVVLSKGKFEPVIVPNLPVSTYTVNDSSDTVDASPGNNVCADSGGKCTLRAAVMEANAHAGADAIIFSAALNGTPIQLTRTGDDNTATNGDLDINDDLTITGNGAAITIIQGSSNASFTGNMGDKAFGINQDGSHTTLNVSISDLTVRFTRNDIAVNGLFTQTGGAMDIFLTGTGAMPGPTTTLTNVTFNSNASLHSYGGAVNIDSGSVPSTTNIFRGTVQITGSTFTGNKTLSTSLSDNPPAGGALNLFGDKHNVTFTSCLITGNQTSPDIRSNAGGINMRHSNGGTITLTNTTVDNNTAGSDGGGILIAGVGFETVNITGGSISGNTAQGFSDSASAGGFFNGSNIGGNTTLSGVTISNNAATAGASGVGGGIVDGANVPLSINNCTITGNSSDSGGGVATTNTGGTQTTTITNSVITGNTATTGGALFVSSGIINASLNYINSNTATTGSGIARTGGTATVEKNWWGCDGFPGAAGCQTGSGTFDADPRIDLRLTAAPTSILLAGTSTLTADVTKDTNAANTNGGNAPSVLVGRNLTFDATPKGSINAPLTVAIPVNGMVAKTFTANNNSATCGAATPSVMLDNGTQTVSIQIQCADLTLAKTNNVSNTAVVGQQWTSTLTVNNVGDASASFTNGQTVLTDNLPNGSEITYGSPITNNANLSCTINGTKDLACTAGPGTLTLAASGGSFNVQFTATATAPATEANPRSGGAATVDPSSLIIESNEGNNSASNTVTVSKANTTTALTSSQNPSVFGQPVTFTATVSITGPGAGSPSGTIQFLDGGNPIAGCTSVVLQNGQAQCQPGSLSVGNHTITAQYSGDTNFNTSTGNMTGNPQAVNKADTSLGLVSSLNPSNLGQQVTFTATISVTAPGAGTPTGTVQFLDGGNPIAGCANASIAAGQATCQTSALTAGNHTITAQYSGDGNFNTSTGSMTGNPQVVNQAQPDINPRHARGTEPTTGTAPLLFSVVLSAPAPPGGVSVDYQTSSVVPSDAATAGATCDGTADYIATSGTISFGPGERIKTVTVTICADTVSPENTESLALKLSNAVGGVITLTQSSGTIEQINFPGSLIISEVRTSGPGGPGDDFVELYNNRDSFLVLGIGESIGLFKMGADCNATPVLIGNIPGGTIIAPRGHYLFVGSQYSIGAYAAGDQTLLADIENDRNLALFASSDVSLISTETRLDAIGFGTNMGGGVCDLLREGSNVPPVSGSTTEHSFHRDSCGKSGSSAFVACLSNGSLVDANNNNTDFVFADTQGTFISGVPQRLGAPGPENQTSPIRRDLTIGTNLLDQTIAPSLAPNRVRDFTSNPGNNSTFGTLSIRRRFTNNTGGNVTRLRFRIVDISTFPSPGGGVADLRAITSTNVGVTGVNDAATCLASTGSAATPCNITVKGTVLEQPPSQPNGGGWNSTLADGTITLGTPLTNGASANLQFLLGVQSTGSFKFYIIVEALP